MENYIIAAAIATVAPGLLIKGITAGLSGVWHIGNRVIYGKQLTREQHLEERIGELEKVFEERLLEISNREKNIDFKLDQLLQHNYQG
jgi:hypothetical protein